VIVASTAVALAAAVATYQVLDDGGSSGEHEAAEIELTPAGEPVPGGELAGLTYETSDGGDAALGDLRGRPVVLNFFASWCTPCRTEMPAFERVHQDLGDDVEFLGLAVNDRPEDVRATVADTGVTYPTGRDTDERVLTAVGALGALPTTVLLDAEGHVVDVRRGELSEEQLRSLLADRLGVGT
jgi:cytochrome c biogenesis protein CcmG, thiol:disulfide interchange protein DsbE